MWTGVASNANANDWKYEMLHLSLSLSLSAPMQLACICNAACLSHKISLHALKIWREKLNHYVSVSLENIPICPYTHCIFF